ncbi:unnamed protein product [Cochlearia groenlandica]
MAITKNMLVASIFTIFFIISYVHCHSAPAPAPEVFDIDRWECYKTGPCTSGGTKSCDEFCKRNSYTVGHCFNITCCCSPKKHVS